MSTSAIIFNIILGIIYASVLVVHLCLRNKELINVNGNKERKAGKDNLSISITKCILVPILILIFCINAYSFKTMSWLNDNGEKWVWLIPVGLVFGWLGDIFLLNWTKPGTKQDIFNLLGLVAFLVGHVLALVFLGKVLHNPPYLYLLIPFVFMPVVIWQTSKIDKDIVMYIAIPIYASLLMLMLGFTGISFDTSISLGHPESSAVLLIGVLFFALSDGMLGMWLFRKIKGINDIHIMLSYGLAQGLLTLGFLLF